MSTMHGPKPKRPSLKTTASVSNNSPSSSTTSSSRQYLEPSADSLSSPASSSARSKQFFYSESAPLDVERSKENVTVTVRFRPLSPREIRNGEEIAWYADGDTIARNENNQSIAYAYDRVFGPTTTTRHVYDVAAQHVVSGAMDGINGTIFAYGITSSGKTHTMHGDQRSPGIIPLAVKDAFSIIQETPSREFLLRVSYLEIYNEVVNDLLNPAGQNLRVREDAQGTFIEGVKEEVVLSPAHVLSLIAAGEEHRHVGSTFFNLLSSRSHTIFTLTIEGSPCGENSEGEAVTLSQLNLIDLAGSESSRAETTGIRRKEGSYINKSLLTLGTVISKLTDEKSSHIPYRDSKLTRLLQSSLSGHGRVSLICTVTPSSSNSEETHNTLKFAHRAKHIEIQAAQNKVLTEKSLIKKYQNEIRCLKEELEQLKQGIVTVPPKKGGGDDILLLKQKLEDGQVRLQSRLEEEEEAKAALMGRIQRLTKLILVSTKASQSPRVPHCSGPRRRHSFGEDELAYLPYRRRDHILDDESMDLYVSSDGNTETVDDPLKEEKRTKKNGLLNWLKLRKRDSGVGTLASSSEKSSGVKSTSSPSTPQADSTNIHIEARQPHSFLTESTPSANHLSYSRHFELFEPGDSYSGLQTPLTSIKTMDQIDLLREQHKILSGEVALQTSSLKRLSDEAAKKPKEQIQVEIRNLKEEIGKKNDQIASLEKQISDSIIPHGKEDKLEESLSVSELMAQLNEKSFELEVKSADNRIIQEELNQKTLECEELRETVVSLKQQLSTALYQGGLSSLTDDQCFSETTRIQQMGKENAAIKDSNDMLLLQAQVNEIVELKKKLAELTDSKNELELQNNKLADESLYAKGLASAAAVELKALSEEVTKLMNQNERLNAELEVQKKLPTQRRTAIPTSRNGRRDSYVKPQGVVLTSDIKRELAVSRKREQSYEAALTEKVERESELLKNLEESKQKEAYLENELANMWILTAKLKKSQGLDCDELTTENQKHDEFDIQNNQLF
ncbi:LOW QUALITY PROTEIN: kinesin-like protein KIN-7K, chloroplastic [Primulina eburnea]|uniref:LOW QUALITY PROTEIN: kinesin-like protein KIN-7K, chloroplastic n=1 Tax=Primulina eburnea TaxID=1245227 RepID=UPI003C6CC388